MIRKECKIKEGGLSDIMKANLYNTLKEYVKLKDVISANLIKPARAY
jgi:hypothetical protein